VKLPALACLAAAALALPAVTAVPAGCVTRGPRAPGPTGYYMAPAKPAPAKRQPPPAPVLDDAGHEAGKATWYGGKHHGGGTASGEIFDENAMTAAHKSLPFDTWVRVVSHANGATAVVRINDRGPYGKGRIIDVSFAAAKLLGMASAGVVPVHLEIVVLGHGRYQRNRKPPPGGPPTQ